MSRKQLSALFTINLAIFTVGSVVSALLPIYAARLGADPALTGYYFSSLFAALAIGTVVGGWLSDRLQRRKALLIVTGTVQIATIWLMGQAINMGQLTVFSAIDTFLVGIQIAIITILAGLFAEESERGRVFGIIASAVALGSLIGGLVGGTIVDRWGFPALFTASAAVTVFGPIAALLLKDRVLKRKERQSAHTTRRALTSRTFLLLFFASVIVFATNGIYSLGKPLMMNKLGFDSTAISSTVAVSGLITLPFPFLIGWLSDRIGRKPLIVFCYLTSVMSLVVLAASVALWHFWVATAIQAMLGASLAVGSALVTDLVPPESLGSAISLFSATNWIGLVIGFAGTGAAIQAFGMTTTLLAGALLALAAVALLIPIRRPEPAPEYAT